MLVYLCFRTTLKVFWLLHHFLSLIISLAWIKNCIVEKKIYEKFVEWIHNKQVSVLGSCRNSQDWFSKSMLNFLGQWSTCHFTKNYRATLSRWNSWNQIWKNNCKDLYFSKFFSSILNPQDLTTKLISIITYYTLNEIILFVSQLFMEKNFMRGGMTLNF